MARHPFKAGDVLHYGSSYHNAVVLIKSAPIPRSTPIGYNFEGLLLSGGQLNGVDCGPGVWFVDAEKLMSGLVVIKRSKLGEFVWG